VYKSLFLFLVTVYCTIAPTYGVRVYVDDLDQLTVTEYHYAVDNALMCWQYLDQLENLSHIDEFEQDKILGRLVKIHAFFVPNNSSWRSKIQDDADFWRHILEIIASKVEQTDFLKKYAVYIKDIIQSIVDIINSVEHT
jgi:hypothetical protein